MRGASDDIHVNNDWWRISCIGWGFVMIMSYGTIGWEIDWLNDMINSPHHRRNGSKSELRTSTVFSSYARTESQNGLFHTHKFNPKMLCHCRGLDSWKKNKKKKKQKTRLGEWHLLIYGGANKTSALQILRQQTLVSNCQHDAGKDEDTLTACNTHFRPHYIQLHDYTF